MNRFLVTALAIGVVVGCGGIGSAASPSTSPSPGATIAASPEPSAAPTTAITTPPSATPTARLDPFPTSVFANLGEQRMPAQIAEQLQAVLAGMAGDGGIAATVMTVDGTWSGAAGSADGTHELQPDSQFGIASVTKSIVAAQVMQLVEAGEIELDAPATDYLPEDFTFDTNGATIRQLLSHRSGIPDWYDDAIEAQVMTDRSHSWELDEVLSLVPAARRPVGVAHEYADTNYNLLGMVIEHVRQRPLAEVLREGVLRVEGVDRLIYQPAEAPTDPMAMPRGESRDALELGGGFLPSISEASTCGAACAMASDPISLARWWRAFCAGEIVSQASLTEMSTFYDNGGEYDYGLGLLNSAYRARVQGVGHLGASFGYKSAAGCLTEDHMVFAVLTNRVTIDSQNLAATLVLAARSE